MKNSLGNLASCTTPDQLAAIMMAYRQASLEEPGQLVGPPLTKDVIAGRIRHVLAMAGRRASEQGIADTGSSLTMGMLP